MSFTYASFQNKAKWFALASSIAVFVMEIVYKRYYFDPHASHPTQWVGSLIDAGPAFHYCWLVLILLTLILSALSVRKWQSISALLLLLFTIYLRAESP
jgi:hypothetical protein